MFFHLTKLLFCKTKYIKWKIRFFVNWDIKKNDILALPTNWDRHKVARALTISVTFFLSKLTQLSILTRSVYLVNTSICWDQCHVQGESKTTIHLTLQKLEISTTFNGHMARKELSFNLIINPVQEEGMFGRNRTGNVLWVVYMGIWCTRYIDTLYRGIWYHVIKVYK